MKRKMKRSVCFLALLGLTWLPHLASAHYDPSLQRWINRDPIGEAGFEKLRGRVAAGSAAGANSYAYILNNPVNEVDPLGLQIVAPPPPVVVNPVVPTFVCFYLGTSFLCEATGIHEWLAGKLIRCFQSNRDRCIERCHEEEAAGEDECRKKPTPREKALCWQQLYEKTSNCIRDCNRQYPEKP